MMTIYLGFIPRINRIDTPYFNSEVSQSLFFTQHLVAEITTSYYPPHYTNSIKLSIEDLDFSDNVNYLWFRFRGKIYYYFIDSIEYTNENLVTINITMDYIQTYMFNIRVSNGIIERKFINRWSDGVINREYLRENVSSGLFEKSQKFYYGDKIYVMIIKSTGALCKHGMTDNTTIFETTDGIIQSCYHYTFVVIKNDALTSVRYDGTVYSIPDTHDLDTITIGYALRKTQVVDAYVVPIEYLSSLFTLEVSTLIPNIRYRLVVNNPITGYKAYLQTEYSGGNTIPLMFSWYYENMPSTPLGSLARYPAFNISNLIDFYSDNYEKNTSKQVLFDSKYMPVMLDENYTYITGGKNSAQSIYPSHYLNLRSLYLNETLNINNGTISIGLDTDSLPRKGNEYDTYVLYSNINSIDLLNDTWNNYVANNKNRWATSGLSAGLAVVDAFVSIASTSFFATKGIDRALADRRSYTKKRHQLKVGTMRHLENVRESAQKSIINDIADLPSGIITPLVAQGTQDANMSQAPNTPKTIGDALANINSKDIRSYWQLFKVRDYEQCAQYFHRNGYLVQEHVSSITNIFQYVQNRYYFNILKMSDITMYCQGCVTDNETIDGIQERLMDGIRLWNTANDITMGDFTYDNVELSYLS